MKTSKGRGGKRAGCGSGRLMGAGGMRHSGGTGSTGLIAGALSLIGHLIPPQRQQGSRAGEIPSSSDGQIAAVPTGNRVAPDTSSGNRKPGGSPLVAWVDNQLCVGCGLCAELCPAGAIGVDGAASIDARRCTGCGQCVEGCPRDAIVLRKV